MKNPLNVVDYSPKGKSGSVILAAEFDYSKIKYSYPKMKNIKF